MNDIDQDLLGLLATVASRSSAHFTHMTLFDQQRWLVDNRNLSQLWQGYCQLVAADQVKATSPEADGLELAEDLVYQTKLCLAERAEPIMPVVAKILLKFHYDEQMDSNWEIYHDTFLHYLTLAYQTVIRENFVLPSGTNVELMAAVLESESHWIENDGNKSYCFTEIRIQFPYARIESSQQRRIIRPAVIEKLHRWNVLGSDKMERQPIGDWDSILVADVLDRPLPLYGSVESMLRPRLILNYIYAVLMEDSVRSGQPVTNYVNMLGDIFMPGNHTHVQQGLVSQEIFQYAPLTTWLPMFLSTNYYQTILMPRTDNPASNRNTPAAAGFSVNHIHSPANYNKELGEEQDYQIAERLTPLIDPTRYFVESNWLDIGKALFDCYKGQEVGLLSWLRHTRKAINGQQHLPHFMSDRGTLEDTTRDIYNTFQEDGMINLKTIAWYASQDNPNGYGQWHNNWCMAAMDKAMSLTHSDVADAFYRIYWLEFAFSSNKGSRHNNGVWYNFKNHRWMECQGGHELRNRIKHDFAERFETMRQILIQQKAENKNDENFRARAEDAIQRITLLIAKLKNNPFKGSIVSELTDSFADSQFAGRLDTNPDLLGLANGVLESRYSTLFRPAKPQDYVAMSTRVSYHGDYTWETPQVEKCMKYLSEVHPDPEMRNHFLKFASSCLRGLNSDKIFPFFVGDGNNSKSMIVKLFETTFGQYCIKFDIANISGNAKDASNASPQLARARGVHIAFIDEPDDDEEIKKGTMKRWIGGDSFFTRMLYDAGGDLRVFFKLVLSCNKPPKINNPDKASVNRIRLYPFIAQWLAEGYPESYEEQAQQRKFKMDPNFEDKIAGMAGAFLWILIQYYPIYKRDGLHDPQTVKDYTATYWHENDIYAQFAAESIQPVITPMGEYDMNARLTITDMYEEFKLWFRATFPGQPKMPDRTVVKSEFISRWGRMQGNHWVGMRLIPRNTTAGQHNFYGGRGTTVAGGAVPLPNFADQAGQMGQGQNSFAAQQTMIQMPPPAPIRLIINTAPPGQMNQAAPGGAYPHPLSVAGSLPAGVITAPILPPVGSFHTAGDYPSPTYLVRQPSPNGSFNNPLSPTFASPSSPSSHTVKAIVGPKASLSKPPSPAGLTPPSIDRSLQPPSLASSLVMPISVISPAFNHPGMQSASLMMAEMNNAMVH